MHFILASNMVCNLLLVWIILLGLGANLVSSDNAYGNLTSEDLKVVVDSRDIGITSLDRQTRSGARSIFQIPALSESFNLLNIFSSNKKLKLVDDNYNLISLDSENEKLPKYTVDNLHKKQPEHTKFHPPLKYNIYQSNYEFENKIDDMQGNNHRKINSSPSNPVVLMPGYGGSRLEAKLDKKEVVHYFCDHRSDWFDIWINVKLILPYMIDCLIDNIRLEFDPITNRTKNTQGVEIRIKNQSHLASVEYLHDLPISSFAYFAPIIDRISDQMNFVRDVNLLGAPYDFRKAPNELESYFAELKESTELLFESNNQEPVTFICHSMGCNNLLYFLQRQSREWKESRVKRLISLAAPWGGSLSAVRAVALGDDLGMPYLFSESKMVQVQRSLPSTIYLFPNAKVFSDIPLIKSNVDPDYYRNHSNSTDDAILRPEKHYMAKDFEAFFKDINHHEGYMMWLNTKDLLGNLEPPGVEVWCLVGVGRKTLSQLEYKGEFPESPFKEHYDDGDGTVNIQSASYCRQWSDGQEQPIFYKEFKVSHLEILKVPEVTEYVEKILRI